MIDLFPDEVSIVSHLKLHLRGVLQVLESFTYLFGLDEPLSRDSHCRLLPSLRYSMSAKNNKNNNNNNNDKNKKNQIYVAAIGFMAL